MRSMPWPKAVGKVLAYISEQYRDTYHASREEVRGTLARFLMIQFKAVSVEITDVRVQKDPADPDRAFATFNAKILVSHSRDVKPDVPFVRSIRGTDAFRLTFSREGRVWRAVSTAKPEKP